MKSFLHRIANQHGSSEWLRAMTTICLLLAMAGSIRAQTTVKVRNQNEFQAVFDEIYKGTYEPAGVTIEVMNDIELYRKQNGDVYLYMDGLNIGNDGDSRSATINGNGFTIKPAKTESSADTMIFFTDNGKGSLRINDLIFDGGGICRNGLVTQTNTVIQRCNFYHLVKCGIYALQNRTLVVENSIFADFNLDEYRQMVEYEKANGGPNRQQYYVGIWMTEGWGYDTRLSGCTFSKVGEAGFRTVSRKTEIFACVFQDMRFCVNSYDGQTVSLGYNFLQFASGIYDTGDYECPDIKMDGKKFDLAKTDKMVDLDGPLGLWKGTHFPDPSKVPVLHDSVIYKFDSPKDFIHNDRNEKTNRYAGAISSSIADKIAVDYVIPDHTKEYDGNTSMDGLNDTLKITNLYPNIPARILLSDAAYSSPAVGTTQWTSKLTLDVKSSDPYVMKDLPPNGVVTFNSGNITPRTVIYNTPMPSKPLDCTDDIDTDTLDVLNRISGDVVKILMTDGLYADENIGKNKIWEAKLSLIDDTNGSYTLGTGEISGNNGTITNPDKIYVNFTCDTFVYNGKPDVNKISNVIITPPCIDVADLNLKVTSKSAEVGTWDVTISAKPKSPYNRCTVELDPNKDVPEVTIISNGTDPDPDPDPDNCTVRVSFSCDTMEYSGKKNVSLSNIKVNNKNVDPDDLGLTATAKSSTVGTWEVNVTTRPTGSAANCAIIIDSAKFTDRVPTVVIVPRTIVADLTAVSREYDGTKMVSLKYRKLFNAVSGEDVSIKESSLIGMMNDKHVGEEKPLSFEDIELEGRDAGNYTLNTSEELTVDIAPAELTVTAQLKNKKNTLTYGDDVELEYTTTPSPLFDKDKLTGEAEVDGKLSPDGYPVPGNHELLVGSLKVDDGNKGKNYDLTFEQVSFEVVFDCKADSDGDGINDCDDIDPFDPEVGGSEVSDVSNSQRSRDGSSNIWQVLCPADGKTAPGKVTVTISAPSDATVTLDNVVIKESSPKEYKVTIDLPKPGIYVKTIVVKFNDGTEENHIVTIEQPLNPEDVIRQKFDNVLILDRVALKSLGITPVAYQWSCDGEEIPGATSQGYSAGDKLGDLLNTASGYTVEITLPKKAGKLHTCTYYPVLHLNSSRLKAWPNPVGRQEVINIEMNSTGDSKSATSTQSTKSTKTAQSSANTKTLRIYNTNGEEIKQISIVEGINKLELGLKRGVYILKIDEEEIRVMVR